MRKVLPLVLATALSTGLLAGAVNAQACPQEQVTFPKSALGIDYKGLASGPIAQILAEGEAEYLRNISAWIGPGWFSKRQLPQFWDQATEQLLKGAYSTGRVTSRDPRFHPYTILAPKTLKRLQACISAGDPHYGHLLRVPTVVPEYFPGESYE